MTKSEVENKIVKVKKKLYVEKNILQFIKEEKERIINLSPFSNNIENFLKFDATSVFSKDIQVEQIETGEEYFLYKVFSKNPLNNQVLVIEIEHIN